jgi:RNA 2',3'-cyclic 3'-phosphodiesterase
LSMRLFLAVNLPYDVAARVEDLRRKLERVANADRLRWTRSAQAHFTLKFLGEQPQEAVGAIGAAAREAAVGVTAFSVSLEGMGGFPSRGRPRTLWIGAGMGSEELIALAAKVDALLVQRGFPEDERPFTPHLTVARAKTRADESAAARAIENAPIGQIAAFSVERFALMQSVSTPEGVRYVALESYDLAGK